MKTKLIVLLIIVLLSFVLSACDLTSGDVIHGIDTTMQQAGNIAAALDNATDQALGNTSGCVSYALIGYEKCP